MLRTRVEVRRCWNLRQRPILWCLLDVVLRERLRREVLVSCPTLIMIVKSYKLSSATFNNNLAQIWAQVLDALKYLSQETSYEDVDCLLARFIADSF